MPILTHMIEVFKTNVEKEFQAHIIVAFLHQQFPGSRINFDLDDCDRILRVEGTNVCPIKVTELMQRTGFDCSVLD